MRHPRLPIILLVATVILLASCGGDSVNFADDNHRSPMMDDSMGHNRVGHDDSSEVAAGARRIEVTATSFAFKPDKITVDVGEDIAIVLTSDDILHDFTIDELDAHVAAAAGGDTETGGLRADEPGRYDFYCSVAGHRDAGMEGTLIVG